MRVLPSQADGGSAGADATSALVEATRKLDQIEWPRRGSQVDPAPFPTDAPAIHRAWQPVVAAVGGPAEVPPVHATYVGLLAGIAQSAFGAEVDRLQQSLCVLLEGTPLRWGAGAVAALVDEAYFQRACRLWARAWAATFNQLKLDGGLGPGIRAADLTRAQRESVVAAARDRYPRLCERTSELRDALLDEARTLCARLVADLSVLGARLFTGELPQVVTRVVPLGDRHRTGWVSRIQLSDGDGAHTWDVVYKPRPLRADQAFYELAAALAQPGDPAVYAPWFVDRGAYGWMEYCRPDECSSVADLEAYYERLGWLTVLVFALEGRDCHAGNVVARGASPVFVDLECLFTPTTDRDGQSMRYPPITATAVLPMTRFAIGEFMGLDVSGFAGGRGGAHYYQTWQITETSTGALTLRRERCAVAQATNVPRLAGAPVNPYAFTAAFLGGMRRAFSRLQAAGSDVLAGADTARFDGLETRVVLRNTSEYVKCLEEATAPSASLSADAEDDFFGRALHPMPGVDAADERACLRRGAIPRIAVIHRDSPAQRSSCSSRARAFHMGLSGVERVRVLLDTGLSRTTVSAQLSLAEQACAAGARNCGAVVSASRTVRPARDARILLERAVACMDARLSDNEVSDWITATASRGGALVLTRMHWGAFTGRAGVAAGYAAADELGVASASRTLGRLRRAATSDAVGIASSLPIEGLDGCAGVLACVVAGVMGTSGDPLHGLLLARLRATPNEGTFGPAHAATLIGLASAFELDPTPSVAELVDARLTAFVRSSELARLVDRDAATPSVKWASPWAMVLAAARAARAIGNQQSLRHLSQAIRDGDLKADAFHDRVFRLHLLLDAGDEAVATTVGPELAQLRSVVSPWTLASQYGHGALLGVALHARERFALVDALTDEIVDAYMARVHAWLDACEDSILNRPLFFDAARGVAGVILRLAQVRAKKRWPGAFVF